MDSIIIGLKGFPGPLKGAEHVMPLRFPFLYVRGALPPDGHRYLTIVGSRRQSDYGKRMCEDLVAALAGEPVVIVSGLALGIDSTAHRAALRHGLVTVAVPGSGLDPSVLYPASHASLARDILAAGGALVSPFPDRCPAATWLFPVRNRLMAALSHATLVIEAGQKSGTLITAKHAAEFNRDVLAVPGSALAPGSAGPHSLMRSGATPIATGDELREALGLPPRQAASAVDAQGLSADERVVLGLLSSGPLELDEICSRLGLEVPAAATAVSSLEIKGLAERFMGKVSALRNPTARGHLTDRGK